MEVCLLWKDVVKSCNNLGDVCLISNVCKDVKGGGISGDIMGVGKQNESMLDLFLTGRDLVVGDGGRIRFWHENWVKEGVDSHLKKISERIGGRYSEGTADYADSGRDTKR
ncbi:hypothetical protein PIB30_070868 [Stylosanthes scabra]|uniref:Uncharacterized protein n=1 Tax=Stylosanthes scabra TaxID=79078 RepID=A0ABU6ZM93_9FABA|nr:hypothetical protein [Stylosanthes scabra]